MNLNLDLKFVTVFLYALFSGYVITGYFIRKFVKLGYTVPDMYKKGRPMVPVMGGLAIMCAVMVAIVLSQLIVNEFSTANLLILYFLVFVHGVFGLIDDLIDIGRKIKVVAPYFMALPVALLVTDMTVNLLFGHYDFGLWYVYLIAPVYVMVVSNLINMHSGYNGLSGGLATIILGFILVKIWMTRAPTELFYLLPLFGALVAFMIYNFYPSRIFLGNSGTLLVGAGIGALLIVYKLELFGVIIFIPHIVNLLMWIYWSLNMKRIPHVKFAKVKKDGTLVPPNALTVKYLVARLFKVNELSAVIVCYAITFVFGMIAMVIA
jgi:UDP-N-acetylglucosamine--dolichyl-phosphate N-acetylglucosaminephosphotransferase